MENFKEYVYDGNLFNITQVDDNKLEIVHWNNKATIESNPNCFRLTVNGRFTFHDKPIEEVVNFACRKLNEGVRFKRDMQEFYSKI